jgi:hypothetical protein
METANIVLFDSTVKKQGEYIWVAPLCDFFGLNVRHQYRAIKADPVLSNLRTFSGKLIYNEKRLSTNKYGDSIIDSNDNQKKYAEMGVIDANGRILLNKVGFLRWVNGINPKLVTDSLREQFITFLRNITNYLYAERETYIELDEQLQVNYNRLQKCKRLYNKLGNEIKRLDRLVLTYVEKRVEQIDLFSQSQLD